jgi:hypothetical protein
MKSRQTGLLQTLQCKQYSGMVFRIELEQGKMYVGTGRVDIWCLK